MAGTVTLNIHPKVDRGFFVAPEDSEWTCYRRNYFQLSVAYSLSSPNPALTNDNLLRTGIMLDYHGRQERVTGFKITIGARVYASDQKIIDLVQHTPKRDKGPQLKPALNLMLPGGDVERHSYHESTEDSEDRPALSGNIPEGEVPRVVTFERIQFKQATANNGKRRAAQQYFSLIVEAYAVILGPQGQEEIRVAVTKSSPVVVRGRSPGHYSDNIISSSESAQKPRPNELTTSSSFLKNEQPSPTSIKSTPSLNPPNTTPGSQAQQTPLQQSRDNDGSENPTAGMNSADLDFLASLEADFDGYQYLPFTLLDPQGKIVVPHDLFYDPHEFPDTHYANMLFSTTDPNLAFNGELNTTFNSNNQNPNANSNSNLNDGEVSNLYQGFFDFPAQGDMNWNAMGRGPSAQGSNQLSQPQNQQQPQQQQQPLDNNGNWFDTFQANNQNLMANFRNSVSSNTSNSNNTSNSVFNMGFNQDNGSTGLTPGTNSGKWMFEFRNSSYGYFPNLPAVGDMHST